ncbi:hypothetical protein PRIPAC_94505 [Pristionchus pacificus]|uniref:Uncharacterized protein n=1 Tax=Pristionchus pacificus TaxID=54126 RepID=A0A2A6CII2_PRIPA|nr:hypothetical protein PRIPAC_94505 [Pristionchus pacificus]|eukprot:PDM77949.1 hypothetical protein PRIPAC_34816 [Pristionchus pacificus]
MSVLSLHSDGYRSSSSRTIEPTKRMHNSMSYEKKKDCNSQGEESHRLVGGEGSDGLVGVCEPPQDVRDEQRKVRRDRLQRSKIKDQKIRRPKNRSDESCEGGDDRPQLRLDQIGRARQNLLRAHDRVLANRLNDEEKKANTKPIRVDSSARATLLLQLGQKDDLP